MFLDKTLQDLDGVAWGEPTFLSYLVTECHRLRTVPLRDFTIGDLRILIGQKISLDYLVPLALMRLVDEPFAEGDFYAGDLLQNVMRLPSEFWGARSDLRRTLDVVVRKAEYLLTTEENLLNEVLEQVTGNVWKYSREMRSRNLKGSRNGWDES